MSSADAMPASVADVGAAARRARVDLANYYVVAVCLGAGLLLVLLFLLRNYWVPPSLSAGPGTGRASPVQIVVWTLFFIGVGVFADRYKVAVGPRTEVSAGFLADFLGAALLGPLPGAIVAASGIIGSYRRGQHARNLFHLSAFAITGGVTGIAYWALAPSPSSLDFLGVALASLVAGVVYQCLNYLLFVPIAWLRRDLTPYQYFKEAFRPFLPLHFFFLILSLGLILSFGRFATVGLFFSFFPVLGLVYAFRAYSRQRELVHSLECFSLQIAASMITALDLKDNYTAQHSARVAQYSYDIAVGLGLSERERDLAHLCGLFHDLGKLSIPDHILRSPKKLESDEWEIVRGHCRAGQDVLSPRLLDPGNMSEFQELGSIVLHHHEHFDGTGYPLGLVGEEIPIISRVVSAADCYSAMIAERPYSPRRSPAAAIAELRSERGRQLDPRVVDVLVQILEQRDDAYRLADQADLFQIQFQKVRFLRNIA